MSYKVNTTPPFRRVAKKLIKKYPPLKNELAKLGNQLSDDPTTGTALGNGCYKIRMAIRSKGKGKSRGARVITHVHVAGNTVFLLSIYDKADQENISDTELKKLFSFIYE